MRVLGILILFMAAPAYVGAAETSAKLDAVRIDLHNESSLQRGARMFVNYCLNCHSAGYMRYSRMAEDLGLTTGCQVGCGLNCQFCSTATQGSR